MKIPSITNGYEQRFCAFIDFLGFSDAVRRGIWTPHEIVSAMKKAAKVSGGEESLIRVTQFSDSLFLSAPATNSLALYSMVSTAFFLTIELAAHGILLRGGITKGELYHQDTLAFGPAFIRAYNLEQAANTPRIIVDADILEHGPWPDEMDDSEIDQLFNISLPQDFDGWRYIDYLSKEHASEFDEGDIGLERHYSTLNSLVQQHKNSLDASIRTKYGWLAAKLKQVGR